MLLIWETYRRRENKIAPLLGACLPARLPLRTTFHLLETFSLSKESRLYSLSISLYSTSSFQSTALKSCYSVIACDLFLISLGFSDYE